MSYRISLEASESSFLAESGESILDAALRQGVNLPYGCRNGACGACKARLLSGQVDHDGAELQTLSLADRDNGFALLCCAQARSDIALQCRETPQGAITAKTLPARVETLDRLADDVIRLRLKLPASERLQFFAGQYVDILLKDGRRRSFSIANAPHDDELLELHIRHITGGSFTDQVFTTFKPRDILRINGPLGSFSLDEASTRPILCVAGGTGFAPIKSIIDHALHTACERPITLFWGARDVAGLYATGVISDWQALCKTRGLSFSYVPVLSHPAADTQWTGQTGFVHRAALDSLVDLADHDVYVCGAPEMITAARKDFAAAGLPDEHFFADAFTFAHDA